MQESKIGKELLILSNKLKRLLDKRQSNLGIYVGQGRLLTYLYRNKENKIYQKDIEQEFQLRGGTVTGLIDGLVGMGYIKRIESESDKRKRKIILTSDGEKVAIKCINNIRELENQLSDILDENEKNVFDQIFNKINKWIDEEEARWENYLSILIQ